MHGISKRDLTERCSERFRIENIIITNVIGYRVLLVFIIIPNPVGTLVWSFVNFRNNIIWQTPPTVSDFVYFAPKGEKPTTSTFTTI